MEQRNSGLARLRGVDFFPLSTLVMRLVRSLQILLSALSRSTEESPTEIQRVASSTHAVLRKEQPKERFLISPHPYQNIVNHHPRLYCSGIAVDLAPGFKGLLGCQLLLTALTALVLVCLFLTCRMNGKGRGSPLSACCSRDRCGMERLKLAPSMLHIWSTLLRQPTLGRDPRTSARPHGSCCVATKPPEGRPILVLA